MIILYHGDCRHQIWITALGAHAHRGDWHSPVRQMSTSFTFGKYYDINNTTRQHFERYHHGYQHGSCKRSDTRFVVWMRHLNKHKTEQLAARLAYQHCGRVPVNAEHHSQGSFNRCYRVKFEDGPDVLVRYPALGRSMFRKEKLHDEVVVMDYIVSRRLFQCPKCLGQASPSLVLTWSWNMWKGYLYLTTLTTFGRHKIRSNHRPLI